MRTVLDTGRRRPPFAATRTAAFGILFLCLLVPVPGGAQVQVQDSTRMPPPAEAVEHLEAITAAFFDTPQGQGLLPTGMAEAEIALEYATLAGRDSLDLRAMTGNMVHVLHALDPELTSGGSGLGYGVRRAAGEMRTAIQLALDVDGISETLRYHGSFVESAATGTLAHVDDAIALARQVQSTSDPRAARRLLGRLNRALLGLAYGDDRDGDGRIGFAPEEQGLAQAAYHLALIRRVEGIGE